MLWHYKNVTYALCERLPPLLSAPQWCTLRTTSCTEFISNMLASLESLGIIFILSTAKFCGYGRTGKTVPEDAYCSELCGRGERISDSRAHRRECLVACSWDLQYLGRKQWCTIFTCFVCYCTDLPWVSRVLHQAQIPALKKKWFINGGCTSDKQTAQN